MAGWRGGACAGGVPLRRPGRPPESGRARGLNPMREAVSLPALDYAGAVSESALRRDGEGRSPMDPLRVTGSVGRGVNPLRLCGRWVFVRAGRQGQPCAPDWMEHLPPGRRKLRPKGWSDQRPGERRGNLPPWDRWGNSPDAGRTLRAGEQDGSAQNRRARSAGSSPSLTKASTARRSAPPVFIYRTPRAKAAGTRKLASRASQSARRIGPPAQPSS